MILVPFIQIHKRIKVTHKKHTGIKIKIQIKNHKVGIKHQQIKHNNHKIRFTNKMFFFLLQVSHLSKINLKNAQNNKKNSQENFSKNGNQSTQNWEVSQESNLYINISIVSQILISKVRHFGQKTRCPKYWGFRDHHRQMKMFGF